MTETPGQALRRLREERGLSQAQLGLKIGVSSSLIGHWESALRQIPDSCYGKLCRALHVECLPGTTHAQVTDVLNRNRRLIPSSVIEQINQAFYSE